MTNKKPTNRKISKKVDKIIVCGTKIGDKKCVKLFKNKFVIRWLIKSVLGIDLTASFHIKIIDKKYKIFSHEKI